MTRSPGDFSITSAPRPQGVNDAGPDATATRRRPAGALSTVTPGQHATLTLARCALAVGLGFALPLGIAATALLTASAAPDSVGPWSVVLDLVHHAWIGPIAMLIPILALPFFGLAPLVALVAVAALVELARPGQAIRPHTVPRRSSRPTP